MLRVSRVTDPYLIPRRLIEQIDQRKYTVDEYYKSKSALQGSILEVFLDYESEIIGFVDYSINELEKEIYINILSIDREYQCDNATLPLIIETFKKLADQLGFTVVWHSYKPSYFIKHGFSLAKGALLEYSCN